MSHEMRLPKLAMSMKEATIIAWLKKEGDTVRRGEPLLQIETDKAAGEVESPVDGVVREILVEKGRTIPVETPIARIE